ncbi:nuclease-related domain-containing protein [Thermodesulfovibrio sp. 3462-1]|uniref:Nuclease-related domain-containing protein n=1 Tax=Thermodesulfovibrio obliviosus TaxID=3118332 RepID=A0AAU8H2P1_9BACT
MREVFMSTYLQQTVSQLEHTCSKYHLGAAVVLVFSIILLPLIPFLTLAGFIISIILFYQAQEVSGQKITFELGIQGERRLRRILSLILPDNYTVFYGYQIPNGGDIDCIVIGPKGVFVMEVKNDKGNITYTSDGWNHIKIGQRGTAYKGSLKDPGRQVVRGSMEIKKLLLSYGIKVPITALVVFTNQDAKLSVESDNPKFKILKVEELPQFFEHLPEKLKDETVERISRVIEANKK